MPVVSGPTDNVAFVALSSRINSDMLVVHALKNS